MRKEFKSRSYRLDLIEFGWLNGVSGLTVSLRSQWSNGLRLSRLAHALQLLLERR